MRTFLSRLIQRAPWRSTLWRAGRFVYHAARGESPNAMDANGEYEIQACLVRTCKVEGTNLVAVDIGANLGAWSGHLLELASVAGVPATVYGFEPVPGTYEALRRNLEGDINAGRFHPMAMAVSDTNGKAEIHVIEPGAGRNSLYRPQSTETTQAVEIECISLEAFAKQHSLQHVHLLKCDAEGHDPKVIRGALPLLASEAIGVLQFEYNHRWIDSRHYLKDVFDWIEGLPYVLCRWTPLGFEGYPHWHTELEKFIECNYLIVHRSALPLLGVRVGQFDRFNAFASMA